jgi:hypothetical protein
VTDDDATLVRVAALPVDWTLQILVDEVNEDGKEPQKLLIAVHGAVIAGTLVAEADWLAGQGFVPFAEQSRSRLTRRRELLAQVAAKRSRDDLTDEERAAVDGGAAFLHLIDVIVLDGSPALTTLSGARTSWRFRLSDVSGWSPAEVTLEPQPT